MTSRGGWGAGRGGRSLRWLGGFLSCWAAVVLLAAPRASAQADERFPMPTEVDPGKVEARYASFHNVPFQDPSLEYAIGIPKGWADVTAVSAGGDPYLAPLSLGAWTEDPAGRSPEIEVSRAILPCEMTLEAWLDLVAGQSGWEVLRRRVAEWEGQARPDLLARVRVGDDARILRIAAVRDAERVFLVAGSATEQGYPRVADDLAVAILSFRLLHPLAPAPTGSSVYRIERPFGLLVSAPTGWEVVGVGEGMREGHGLVCLHPSSEEGGRVFLRVHLAANEAGLDEAGAAGMALEAARAAGFRSARVLVELPCRAPRLPEGRFALLGGSDDAGDMELRVFVFACPTGRLTVSGYWPAYDASPATWRFAMQALETLVRDLAWPENGPDFPILSGFLLGHYHPEVWGQFADHEAVWRDFADRAGPGKVSRLRSELDELGARSPAEVFRFLAGLKAAGLRLEGPENAVEWLARCRTWMAEAERR